MSEWQDALARYRDEYLGPHLSTGLQNIWTAAKAVPEFVGPPADIKETVAFSGATMDDLRAGDYGGAASNMLMTGAALGMTMLPGTVGGVQKAGGAMTDALDMYRKKPGSDPRYLGTAPDRSSYSLLRHRPARGVHERTVDALDAMRTNRGGTKDKLLQDIRRGQELGGDDWYNTEELRDWFTKELGEEQGHAEWVDFMDLMGATSPGNKVMSNIGNASYYRSLAPGGGDVQMAAAEAARVKGSDPILQKGYGHLTQKNQAKNILKLRSGKWVPEVQTPSGVKGLAKDDSSKVNPKPRGFSQSLIGNAQNIAADLHFTRYMAMASGRPDWLATGSPEISAKYAAELQAKYGKRINKFLSTGKDTAGKPTITFNARGALDKKVTSMEDYADEPGVWAEKPKDNEYAAFEKYINEVGEELGMTGPQVQANLWMGAADRTGVDPSSQGTFMELLRKRADVRAADIGSTREQVLKDFITKRGLLALPAGAVGGTMLQQLMAGDSMEGA